MITSENAGTFLQELFKDAVESALPATVLAAHLPDAPRGRCVVIGAGKASAAMAAALEAAWPDANLDGVVVTRYGHAVPCSRIKILEAAHPVPDENSLFAAQEILSVLENLSADDLVIALISGGGSALMVAPIDEIGLAGKQAINASLLSSGASIHEMNVVRQALSTIKGGKLLKAAMPARVLTLLISDVPGDDPAAIASGPTLCAKNVAQRALDIIGRFDIHLPKPALGVLQALASENLSSHTYCSEARHDVQLIATPQLELIAAAKRAKSAQVRTFNLGDALEGEARELGSILGDAAVLASECRDSVAAPVALLSGGETTVSIGRGGAGRGGRNTEFLLSLAITLNERSGIYAIACDTDGIDGTEDAAGATVTPDTLARGRALNLDAADFLRRHDSYTYFRELGDLVFTGPTLTNVNDFRAILVL